ncbi:hypothetical protein SAMN05443633_11233 [Chryseobacterium arachidis]|uniref:HEPN AbiU2-like domain-containing protein n=1 Tax=Chryseobacterium arachidis TaxID=1416778 RepID=A0A1M5I7Y8_9FLAO|nr:hypothetical protein [Chryseobacterium arachidis]SHG24372.1 hypothetical protein SAMN05443633_11233 [Chryseobacterium arachidis]
MDILTSTINREIANFFISDSKEFLFRYQKLKEFQNHLSNRSKLMIDLLFSIECSLKALIFFESTEDEKMTYKRIKTHNLKNLSDRILDRTGLADLEQSILDNSEIYNVSSRHTLDANINFREEHVLGRRYYGTIADFVWLEKLYEVAKGVMEFAESKDSTVFQPTNFTDFDLDILIEKSNRIINISTR